MKIWREKASPNHQHCSASYKGYFPEPWPADGRKEKESQNHLQHFSLRFSWRRKLKVFAIMNSSTWLCRSFLQHSTSSCLNVKSLWMKCLWSARTEMIGFRLFSSSSLVSSPINREIPLGNISNYQQNQKIKSIPGSKNTNRKTWIVFIVCTSSRMWNLPKPWWRMWSFKNSQRTWPFLWTALYWFTLFKQQTNQLTHGGSKSAPWIAHKGWRFSLQPSLCAKSLCESFFSWFYKNCPFSQSPHEFHSLKPTFPYFIIHIIYIIHIIHIIHPSTPSTSYTGSPELQTSCHSDGIPPEMK